jgi:hypothetical protein
MIFVQIAILLKGQNALYAQKDSHNVKLVLKE